MNPLPKPLDGITVLTLEHTIAAPFCTRQLADQGARVIKIERPGSGDFARAYDERVEGLSSHFVWTNRSKESMTLDVKHPQAAEVLARLLRQADVLVQNLARRRVSRHHLSAGPIPALLPPGTASLDGLGARSSLRLHCRPSMRSSFLHGGKPQRNCTAAGDDHASDGVITMTVPWN